MNNNINWCSKNISMLFLYIEQNHDSDTFLTDTVNLFSSESTRTVYIKFN